MPIIVKHAPSAAAIGESAYTVGRGQRQERDIRLAAEVSLKQRSLNIQAARVGDRSQEWQGRLEQQEAELDFREQQWQEEPARQLQQGLEQQKHLQSKISWQYDEGQKREMAKVTTGVAWLRNQVSAGKWTAEQAEQAEQQLWKKYYSIIPLPFYDDKATPQERWKSGLVTGEDGVQRYQKASGDWERIGPSVLDRSKIYIGILGAMKTQNMDPDSKDFGKETLDTEAALLEYNKFMTMISKEDGLAARVEDLKVRQQGKLKRAADDVQKEEMQAKIEALPEMFEKITPGQPKIGRKKKGPPSLFADDVYGEEAYNLMLAEATQRGERMDIAPDVMKAEFDKWWDAQYDKERGERFQKFGDRMKFKSSQAPTLSFGDPAAGLTPKKDQTKRQKAIDYVKGVLQEKQYASLSDKVKLDKGVKMLAEAGFKVTADELKTKPAEFDSTAEAAEPQSQTEFIRIIQSMEDKKKAKAYYDKWASKWQ